MLSLMGHCAAAVLAKAAPNRRDNTIPWVFISSHFEFHYKITDFSLTTQSLHLGISTVILGLKVLKSQEEYPHVVIIDSQKNSIFAPKRLLCGAKC